jgi:hypothetical protein
MFTFLILMHIIGLILGAGAATVKIILLLKTKSDYLFLPAYIKASNPITKLIVSGLVLMTLSGIGFLLYGFPFSDELIIKLILVTAVWLIGPYIDKVIEPKFKAQAEIADNTATAEFKSIQKKYFTAELLATGLFYLVILYWILK